MECDDKCYEYMRMKIWAESWCAVASAFNCDSKSVPTRWADSALKDFDERFNITTEGVHHE